MLFADGYFDIIEELSKLRSWTTGKLNTRKRVRLVWGGAVGKVP